jgi:Kdo2-lipid IVA lauroyltransferase/acyltransferase
LSTHARGAATEPAAPEPSPGGERDLRLGGRWTPRQRLKNDAIHAAASAALMLVPSLPGPARRGACALLADAAWLLWRAGRARVARNLALALGPAAPSSRQVFRGLAGMLDDTLSLLGAAPAAGGGLVFPDGDRETLSRAISAGKGVVLATAHLGPWERLGALLVEHGVPLATVARRSYDPRFDALYERLRERRGLKVIYRGAPGSTRALVRALRAGMVVGFPMDMGGRGVRTLPCPWPGGALPIALGPAQLALRTGAEVVVVTPAPAPHCPSTPPRLRIRVERIALERFARGDAEALTLALGKLLGDRVRALPTLWPWMHLDL